MATNTSRSCRRRGCQTRRSCAAHRRAIASFRRKRPRCATWCTHSMPRPAKMKWEREAVRRHPLAAVTARTRTHPRHPSPTANGSTRRSARTSGSSAIRSTASCCGNTNGNRIPFTSTSARPHHRSFTGRLYLLQDNEEESAIIALDATTGKAGVADAASGDRLPKSSWMTPFIWKNAIRTEIITTGHGFVISYGLDGQGAVAIGGMSMPTPSPLAADGMLYVGTGSQGDANRPSSRSSPARAATSRFRPARAATNSSRGRSRAPLATRRRRSCTTASAYSSTTPGSYRPERENRQAGLQGTGRRGRQHVLGFAGRGGRPHPSCSGKRA